MKVSIITAFYKGNAYMQQYKRMICANQQQLSSQDELEAIIINDSPEESVVLPEVGGDCNIRVYDQRENSGIHAARVRGLLESSGDYIIFLDQDDLLADDAVAHHIAMMRRWQQDTKEMYDMLHPQLHMTSMAETMRYPVLVSNAVLEQADGSALWYRTDYHKRCVCNYKTYLNVGNQIISPGQCLIPRCAIPEIWTQKICQNNGSDDYYLWLLLFAQHTPFVLVDEPLYVHKYTAQNLSADSRKMDVSTYEFVAYLEAADSVEQKDLRLLERTTRYKDRFRNGGVVTKLLSSIRNPDILLANIIFKIRTKTPYGFNR